MLKMDKVEIRISVEAAIVLSVEQLWADLNPCSW